MLKNIIQIITKQIIAQTRMEMQAMETRLSTGSKIPVGSIFAFPTNQNIEGFFLCDGSNRFAANFPLLAAMCEPFRGLGVPLDNFTVPDFRGYYLRGADNGTGRISPNNIKTITHLETTNTNTVGMILGDLVKQHAHQLEDMGHSHLYDSVIMQEGQVDSTIENNGITAAIYPGISAKSTDIVRTGISVLPYGDVMETRPKSVLVNFYIKHD